jgi:hypothetical protein
VVEKGLLFDDSRCMAWSIEELDDTFGFKRKLFDLGYSGESFGAFSVSTCTMSLMVDENILIRFVEDGDPTKTVLPSRGEWSLATNDRGVVAALSGDRICFIGLDGDYLGFHQSLADGHINAERMRLVGAIGDRWILATDSAVYTTRAWGSAELLYTSDSGILFVQVLHSRIVIAERAWRIVMYAVEVS